MFVKLSSQQLQNPYERYVALIKEHKNETNEKNEK